MFFTGSGEKAFSAGFDIGAIPTEVTPEIKEMIRTKIPLEVGLESIDNYPYPIIAMINGICYGAGCEFATTCDIRIVADTAEFGMLPARIGILYSNSGILHFINVVGVANTKEIFLTAKNITAQRAREIGLVNYVVPKKDLVSVTYELARQISENASLSLSGTKTIISKILSYQKLKKEDEEEVDRLIAQAMGSEDLREGKRAFFEKRKPTFKGK